MLRLSLLTLVGASLLSVSPARSQETDPYAGTFSDGNLTVTLIRSESGFNGKARVPEGEFSIAAQRMGNRLVGTYTIDGTEFLFQASLRGDVLILTAEGRTFTLERQSPAAETATGASRGNPPAAGRDTQLTQLLLSSRWCHFSYRGSSNNTGSGTSHQESVTFNRDGTAQVQTGGENYSSGNAGSVSSQRTGGTVYRWRAQDGMLHLSEDGVQWSAVALTVTQNSNGYPIITADGKEYSQC